MAAGSAVETNRTTVAERDASRGTTVANTNPDKVTAIIKSPGFRPPPSRKRRPARPGMELQAESGSNPRQEEEPVSESPESPIRPEHYSRPSVGFRIKYNRNFEDAALHEAACHAGAVGIVTRSAKGFRKSTLRVYSPMEGLRAPESPEIRDAGC
jgi:hypothetical protein